jgi:hypothetical protein
VKALVAALALLLLAACAHRGPAPVGTLAAEALSVEIVRDGDRWTADFAFPAPAPVWVFPRSWVADADHRPWRPRSWTVETPGVRLERRGNFDVLVAERGSVPQRVRIRFTPFQGGVVNDYDPAIIMTDGTVALFTEHFDAFPFASAAAVAGLPADLAGASVPERRTRMVFRERGGEVLYGGRRQSSVTVTDLPTYVLFGRAEPIVSDAMSTIIDPQLPAWLRGTLARAAPGILARYAAALGPAPGPKPILIVSWAGPTPGMRSMRGHTLRALIVMRFEGERVLREDAESRGAALWFIAHEAAHFWLGQAVRYENVRDSWITEGGADLLAICTVALVDPGYDWRAELQREIDDCVALTAGRGVATAFERNQFRAYYACGAVFALVAEAASRRPFARFVRTLIDANRADGVLTRAEWLAEIDRVSNDPSLSRDIGLMLDGGIADPKAMIASLFTRAGIRFTRGEDGGVRLQ